MIMHSTVGYMYCMLMLHVGANPNSKILNICMLQKNFPDVKKKKQKSFPDIKQNHADAFLGFNVVYVGM